jgi:glutaredoxin
MTSSVVVFTTPGCPYCKRAKQALSEQKVPYKVIQCTQSSNDLHMHMFVCRWCLMRCRMPNVP